MKSNRNLLCVGAVTCQLSMNCLSALSLTFITPLVVPISLWLAGPVLSDASWGSRRDTTRGREFYSFCCDLLPTGSCDARLACRAASGRSISGEAFPQVPQALYLVSWPPSYTCIFPEFLRTPSPTFFLKVTSRSSRGAPHNFLITSASSPSHPGRKF